MVWSNNDGTYIMQKQLFSLSKLLILIYSNNNIILWRASGIAWGAACLIRRLYSVNKKFYDESNILYVYEKVIIPFIIEKRHN